MACPRTARRFLDELVAHSLATLPRLALVIKTELIGFWCVDAFEANFDAADFNRIAVNDARDAYQIRSARAGRSDGQQQNPG